LVGFPPKALAGLWQGSASGGQFPACGRQAGSPIRQEKTPLFRGGSSFTFGRTFYALGAGANPFSRTHREPLQIRLKPTDGLLH